MSAERRKNARLGLAIPVRVQGYRSDGSTWEEFTTTDDVSVGGACFALSHEVELGQILFLTLALPKRLRQFDLSDSTYRIYTLVRSVRRRPDQPRVGVMYFGKYPPRGFHDRPGARYLLPTDASNGTPAPPSPPTPAQGTAAEAPATPPTAEAPPVAEMPPAEGAAPPPPPPEPETAAPAGKASWGTEIAPPPSGNDPYPESDEPPSLFSDAETPSPPKPAVDPGSPETPAPSPADSQPRVANWGTDTPPEPRPGIPSPPPADAPAVEFHPSREVPNERRSSPRVELFVNFVIQEVDEWGAVLQEELTVADNVGRGGARVMTTLGFGAGTIILLQEAGGSYATRAEVRGVTHDRSGTSRLHLRFVDREAPERILKQ